MYWLSPRECDFHKKKKRRKKKKNVLAPGPKKSDIAKKGEGQKKRTYFEPGKTCSKPKGM